MASVEMACLHMLQAEVATVLREGRLRLVPASDLVPGDIVEVAGEASPSMTTPLWPASALL